MTVGISPIGNDAPFFLSTGVPASGAKLFIYASGSTTKVTSYSDSAGNTQNANPLVLNSSGYPASAGNRVAIWLTDGSAYKFVLAPSTDTDPPTSPYWTLDNIPVLNDVSVAQSEWVGGPTPTYISATSLSLVGDQTGTFHVGRRLKTTNTAGTIYSTIISSAYTSLTTITVVNDSGSLDSGLSAVSYGILDGSNISVPPSVGTVNLTSVAGSNTITASATKAAAPLSTGQMFSFVPAASNTGATTLNINSLGAKNIFLNGSALVGYEIRKSCPVHVYYDGTQFNIIAGAHGGDGVPIGVIKDRGFGTVANGYLACDGSAVSRTTYADLFATVGTTWGSGDGSTTFNVPPPSRFYIGSGTATTTETLSSVTASGNAVAVASNNTKWITGMPVTVTNASGFTGLVNGSYWIIRASSTSVKFATSLANAQNGTAMSVSGTGSATLTTTWTARTIGEVGGEESHAMSSTEQLAHTHIEHSHSGGTNAVGPSTGTFDSGDTTSDLATGSTGGNAAMNVLGPFAVVLKMIKA